MKNISIHQLLLILLACLSIAFLCVGSRVGFLGDDLGYFHRIEQLHGLRGALDFIVQPFGGGFAWRPLTDAVWRLEHAVLGYTAVAYHTVQVLIFFLTCVVGYAALRRLYGQRIAAVSVALFALMPFHYEAIVWLAGLVDTLAFFCSLLALYCFIRYREDGGRRWFVWTIVATAAAMLAKETGLAVPFVLMSVDLLFYRNRGTRRTRFQWYGIIAGVTAVYVLFHYLAIGSFAAGNSAFSNPARQLVSYHVWMTFVRSITILFNASEFKHLLPAAAAFWLTWKTKVAVAALMLLCVLRWRSWRDVAFLRMAAFGAMMIVLFVIPQLFVMRFISLDLQQSRYLYAPSFGVAVLLAILLVGGSSGRIRNAIGYAGTGILMVTFAFGLVLNVQPWLKASAISRDTLTSLASNTDIVETTRPAVLFVSRLSGAVEGAFVFHDYYSFDEAVKIRFRNPNLIIELVTKRAVPMVPCTPIPNVAMYWLSWEGSQFIRHDAEVATWLEQPKPLNIGFASLEQFQQSWTAQDLAVTDATSGVQFVPTGKNPEISVNIPTGTHPRDLQEMQVQAANAAMLDDMTLVWRSVDMNGNQTDHEQDLTFDANGAVSLCTYPIWFTSGEIQQLTVRFPRNQAVILRDLSL